MGTREHAGLRRLLSGSVSHYCLSHAVCPVVAVPAPASDRRAEDSDTVGPDTAAGIDQDLETVIPGAEKMIDEAAVPGTTLLVGVRHRRNRWRRHATQSRRLRFAAGISSWCMPFQLHRRGLAMGKPRQARTTAENLLASLAAQLTVPPQLHVYTMAEPGDPVTVLKWSAGRAAMLVLGRDQVSWGQRLFMGGRLAGGQSGGMPAGRGSRRMARPAMPGRGCQSSSPSTASRTRSPRCSWPSRRRGCVTLD